ncbi:hypothetical protein HYH03_001683 [Edaphochlamys debaryana]|uniref:LisH domain-containing protein n=1 Tax=Edaphochlamys debaryana TaxID=47281 RepID=A0A835YBX1_9CHLO|nr:hypothetical protein HYH03_001683 [Edaphochlamys debaryana]|eukprot:KAG2500100.1 hypothetical protein HYH03_001683 [Edaphochlamys debaryana]
MDAIKQAVTQTLEKQGIIAQLKAQLRAQVFIAVEEYESASSTAGMSAKTSTPARKALLADPDGQLAIQLVLDLLDTCNFSFTKQVFHPELGPGAPESGRQAAASKLGLRPSNPEEPLLLTLVKSYKSGGGSRGGDAGSDSAPTTSFAPAPSTSTSAPAPPAKPTPSSTPAAPPPLVAPLARLEPLAPLGKAPPLGPLPGLGGSKSTPAPQAPPAKPAPEPSGGSAYSDEDFEEEPVEEAVEEEGAEAGGDDDEDDYATAMGFKRPASSKPDLRSGSTSGDESGRDRPGAGGRGRTALDADLMAGDRSFGVSNELAGLDAGNSGGLSFSSDFPPAGLALGDPRASLSSSAAMLSPISEGTPKLSKLEPLKPLGAPKLSPLAPLAPLPTLGAKLGPLGGPVVRKSLADIEKEKEELRKLGLLSNDSLSTSMDADPRARASGPPGNIYDAEMSVSASMDDGGSWAGPGVSGSGGGAREDRLPFASKGLSMDMRETGLSASDRSGDITDMGVDLAETAEWH